MPFPYKPAAKDDVNAAPAAPAFSKKFARKRKNRKAAPIQKSMMSSGRALGGGGR
jgi:hypothetical protein